MCNQSFYETILSLEKLVGDKDKILKIYDAAVTKFGSTSTGFPLPLLLLNYSEIWLSYFKWLHSVGDLKKSNTVYLAAKRTLKDPQEFMAAAAQ